MLGLFWGKIGMDNSLICLSACIFANYLILFGHNANTVVAACVCVSYTLILKKLYECSAY